MVMKKVFGSASNAQTRKKHQVYHNDLVIVTVQLSAWIILNVRMPKWIFKRLQGLQLVYT